MWQTTLFAFFAGVLGANGVPHFVKGITKESFPTLFGSSAVANLIGGWILLCLAAVLAATAGIPDHPLHAFIASAVGVLLMGLFHATIGAQTFGRPSPRA